MRSARLVLLALPAALLLPLAPAAAPASAEPAPDLADLLGPVPERGGSRLPGADVVPGELLVTTRSAPSAAALRRSLPAATGLVGRVLSGRVLAVQVAPGQEAARAAELRRRPDVVAVERPQYRQRLRDPGDPLFAEQWAHRVSRAQAAWDVTTGSPDVRVAVLDSGVDARHPDLDNVVQQRSFARGVASVPATQDNRRCDGDHGSHVAGIVGADGDDGVGVTGVAWRVSLLDYNVFTESGGECFATDTDVIAGIRAAVAAGADVVNLSLGGLSTSCSTAYQAALDDARAAGVLVVAASGNEQQSDPGVPNVPAACDGVVSVGAVTVTGARAPYSTSNAFVDLTAPGGNQASGFADGVLSTVGEGRHDWLQGTSMATPYVAGAAALLRAADPAITPDQMEALLETTAVDRGSPGRDSSFGWGSVDVGAAVARAARRDYPALQPDPSFPVGGGGTDAGPPPGARPDLFRVDDGGAPTTAVPQAVALSQVTFDDQAGDFGVLARSDDYPDALAGSSLAFGVGPLLFTGRTGPLAAETRAELQRTLPGGATVYLLGGPAALPTTLEGELTRLGFRPVRLAGQNREQTAVAAAAELDRVRARYGFGPADGVLLARSNGFADALSGGTLGAYFGLPILLSPTASLSPTTRDRLAATRPPVLLPLGGPAALSDATVQQAATASGAEQVQRLQGQDRYGTAAAVAGLLEALLVDGGGYPPCALAADLQRAGSFSFALAASMPAGAYGCVMVGVDGNRPSLPAASREYARGLGVDGILVGGTDVVADPVGAELIALLREGS